MSLTRDEWCKMWEAIKVIELETTYISMNSPFKRRTQIIKDEANKIKKQIQSVIGQME